MVVTFKKMMGSQSAKRLWVDMKKMTMSVVDDDDKH
jgi:hypothetical protein